MSILILKVIFNFITILNKIKILCKCIIILILYHKLYFNINELTNLIIKLKLFRINCNTLNLSKLKKYNLLACGKKDINIIFAIHFLNNIDPNKNYFQRSFY